MADFVKVLHNDDGLEITFFADGPRAWVEFRGGDAWDLSSSDDVVVAVNGEGVEVECRDANFASAQLGEFDSDDEAPIQLMVRVGEFFEGWELD